MTLLVGGAGSGKTTVLAQAMADEHDHVDVWVPCRAVDRETDRLLTSVLGALGGDPVDEALIDAIVERIIAASPRQVCLVLDDVHVLGRGQPLEALLAALPTNGHVLLAGRARPAIDTARLEAAGQLEEIEQDELLMTDDEVIAFANLRGIDVSALAGANGWPAFVELASTGREASSLRYLDEEALRGIPADRRRALAAFAFVGGGDDAVATEVAGMSLDELVDGVPLVRWSGQEAQLHDLWGDLLAGELDDAERRDAANSAARVARAQRDIDRAIDLGRSVGDWDDVAESLRTAIRDGVAGGVRAEHIRRWRGIIPDEIRRSAIGVLLDGILERERDPTSPAVSELLDRAAGMFERDGEPELELVALTQLGYVAHISGAGARVEVVGRRFSELAERHPPARPFTAIGAAWASLNRGDPAAQLDALRSIGDDDLPGVWRITRRHLIAHALFNLGRAAEGLAIVPTHVDTLPVPIPGALITESQCRWLAGQPDVALANPPHGASDRHGARDRFIAAAWLSLMRCYAGDLPAARAAAVQARDHGGTNPSPLVAAQLAGLDAMITVGEGDVARATAMIEGILALAPLEGIGRHLFRHQFVYPYLLVPSTREFWDGVAMPDQIDAIRRLVRSFTAAREREDLGALATVRWPEPGLIAAYVPNHWAMELALTGIQSGRHEARHLAAWLCEHWQQAARSELARWVDDDRLGVTARDVAAHTPTPPPSRIGVRLLGHAEVDVDGRATAHPDWRRERVRALLTWLVLHPNTSREQATTALWPDLEPGRAAKNLRTTLNYLHGILEPGRGAGDATWYVRSDGQRLDLHRSLDVDVRRFADLLDQADETERAGHPLAALPLLTAAISEWRGDLAVDLDYEWLDLERIHLRSRFVRAACRTAELFTAIGQGDRAIDPARAALDADPYHGPSYRALAEAYRGVGDHTSARTILERADEVAAL